MFINLYLLRFMVDHGFKILKTCILQLLMTALSSLVALSIALLVRMIQGEKQILFFNNVWQIILVICIFTCIRFFLSRIKTILSEECGLNIKKSLRLKLLQKLFALGPAYVAKERTGKIASTITTKIEYLNEYYTIYIPTVIACIINSIILILVISKIDILTAIICIIASIGIYICPMLFYFLMRKRGDKEMRAHAEYYSDCLDSIQGISTLKAFNANANQKRKIHEKGEELRQAVMSQLRITMLENVVLQFFSGLGGAISVAVAAYQCSVGKIESSHLVYALFIIGACFAPMSTLISAWHFGYRGVVASYSIIELLQEPITMSLYKNNKVVARVPRRCSLDSDISFDNVSFSYAPKDGDVLSDVSFSITSGTTTAIIGVSGSGKSTIAHLLAGFYPVTRGTITVDSKKLCEETVSDIQDLISAVWQDCRMFYGTVEDNILIGKPSASHEDVITAAKEASIHEFIMSLPDGYQTMIGERGMRFSGGQRQRIAIARALLRDAPILILDEATSSLDRQNELEIQNSLKRLSSGRTCLVIAHRLATIKSADQIIILDKGKIVEKGTHEELLNSSTRYQILMGSQMTGGDISE